MGDNGRALAVSRYSRDRFAADLESVLQNLVDNNHRRQKRQRAHRDAQGAGAEAQLGVRTGRGYSLTMTTSAPSSPQAQPPEAWEPALRLLRLATRPLDRFLQIEAASGIVLLLCAATAIGLANSPWADAFHALWQTPIGLRVGDVQFARTLEWFVNDVLMVVFFFVVGLEIRREMHHGELSEWRRAALPALAALGGMIAPALVFATLVKGDAAMRGWGVPMATDIAFAVGVLALLGRRVPPALRVLLLALAVIDDLGAIVIIALFYSDGLQIQGLLIAAFGLILIVLLQRFGIRKKLAYVPAGFLVWAGIYSAGIHPTIAGVLVGLFTPVRAWLGPEGFLTSVRQDLEAIGEHGTSANPHIHQTLQHIDEVRREAVSPAESLIHLLHPYVAFAIMPLFALSNAGVHIDGKTNIDLPVLIGVAMGLVVGKPLGILLAIFAAVRLRIGTLPHGISFKHLLVLGAVAGIGFTMAIFVAQLAYQAPALLTSAKMGVLVGSGVAAVLGLVLGRVLLPAVVTDEAAKSADEAESATDL